MRFLAILLAFTSLCLAACPTLLPVGTRELRLPAGRRGRAWYPTTAEETDVRYPGRTGRMARLSRAAQDGPLATCEKFPVIVFSHGLGGAPANNLPLMEELARRGYIVVGLQHHDSQGRHRFTSPERWSEASFANRYDDIRALLDHLPKQSWLAGQADLSRIGMVGHSLGGYTALGMAGGWGSWKDSRIRAAVLFSPFAIPFSSKGAMSNVTIPLLYQGGTQDIPITPSISKPGGAYAQSVRPKYYVEFKGAGHLAWTNAECGLAANVSSCGTQQPLVKLQTQMSVAFLDQYLKKRTGVYGNLAEGNWGSQPLVTDWRMEP